MNREGAEGCVEVVPKPPKRPVLVVCVGAPNAEKVVVGPVVPNPPNTEEVVAGVPKVEPNVPKIKSKNELISCKITYSI